MERAFRVLSYYFTVAWDDPTVGDLLGPILAPFATEPDPRERRVPPTPGLPAAYEVRGETGGSQYDLLQGDTPLLRDVERDAALRHLLWHVDAEAARQTGDFLLVHAGAVTAGDGRAVVLPAATGGGKTTLVAALVRAGYGYLSDEAAAIDPVTRRVYPYPRMLTFKRDPADLFADVSTDPPIGGRWHVPAERFRPGALAPPGAPIQVVAFRYAPDTAPDRATLSPAAAVTVLGRHALNLRRYGARGLRLLADAVGAPEHWLVTFRDLRGAVATLRDLTGGP